jgi:hypothetical protein
MLATLAVAFVAAFLSTSPTWAGVVGLGTHSPSEIYKTCMDNGGSPYANGPANTYGCTKGDNSVVCSHVDNYCVGNCEKCGTRQAGKIPVVGVQPIRAGNALATANGPKVKSGITTVPVKTKPVTTGSGHDTVVISRRFAHDPEHLNRR